MLFKKCLILVLICLCSSYSFANQYNAKVIKVIDGDTVWVKSNNKHIKIRLSYIDAPELRQPYGVRSKDFLTNILQDKDVEIYTTRKDRYNRHLGEIYIHNNQESIFVNAKMLKSGNAWVYKKHRSNSYLLNLENYAKSRKSGFWSLENPIEPWIYRKK